MKTLTALRDWIMAPIAALLRERNALLDHRNYLLTAHLTDEQFARALRRKSSDRINRMKQDYS
jgi:predicted branched-subunit amino acid permease